MSDFRSVPLKKPCEVDIVKPLKNVLSIISSAPKCSKDFTNEINEFGKLRSTALWRAYEKQDGALEAIYNYFDQLNALEKKIPVGELQIPFKWKDAFCKGGFLTKKSLTIPSIGYEKTCVLFNIAALQSHIGSMQSIDEDEGLKQAARMFQQSSGIYDYLKNNSMATLPREPTPDLYPETLSALSSLMLAQAQEVFVHKSRRDRMKNELVAKISNETSILYNDSLKTLQNPHTTFIWDKETIPTVLGKQAMFQGIAEFHQSLECKEKKAIGEHIARLNIAMGHLKSALKYSSRLTKASELIAVAEQLLKDAIKENDYIFHDKVPDSNTLGPIGRASLVRPQPLPSRFSNEFRDLFKELVPAAVQKALTSFETRKQEMVQSEVYRLREATQLLNGILVSLNLPAAIEDTVEQEVPPSLVTKSTAVRNLGGATIIGRMLDRLPDLQARNTEILDEIEKMLHDEEESDDQLRKKYREKWTRKNSSRLTSSFRANLEKYRRTINSAIQADTLVRGKFEGFKNDIELLGKGPTEVARAIPHASLKKPNQESQSVSRLTQLMKEVETIKIERDSIENEMKAIKGDTKDTFLSALTKGNVNEETIVEDGLARLFNPIQQKVKNSLSAQERLIENIHKANAQFNSEKKEQNVAAQEREKVLKKLAVAYDAFMELSNNLDEGTKFYNDLTEVLILFQSKVADFCFARKTEKEELVRNLEIFARRGSSTSQTNDNAQAASHQQVPTAACSATLPYPSYPQSMPMPYGSHLQLPYPQYFMPPVPNVYYSVPLPNSYQPQQTDPKVSEKNQNPHSS